MCLDSCLSLLCTRSTCDLVKWIDKTKYKLIFLFRKSLASSLVSVWSCSNESPTFLHQITRQAEFHAHFKYVKKLQKGLTKKKLEGREFLHTVLGTKRWKTTQFLPTLLCYRYQLFWLFSMEGHFSALHSTKERQQIRVGTVFFYKTWIRINCIFHFGDRTIMLYYYRCTLSTNIHLTLFRLLHTVSISARIRNF